MWFCQHCTFKCNTTESALAHEEQSDFKHYTLWVADGYEQLSSK